MGILRDHVLNGMVLPFLARVRCRWLLSLFVGDTFAARRILFLPRKQDAFFSKKNFIANKKIYLTLFDPRCIAGSTLSIAKVCSSFHYSLSLFLDMDILLSACQDNGHLQNLLKLRSAPLQGFILSHRQTPKFFIFRGNKKHMAAAPAMPNLIFRFVKRFKTLFVQVMFL